MSIALIALTPVAALLGYLCWQMVRNAGQRVSDHGRRHNSDGAPGHGPGSGADTGSYGFFGGFGSDHGSGGGYCDSGGFSDGGGGCDGGGGG